MSWQDNINNIEFEITTGDGRVWNPKWLPRSKVIEMNTTIYDYPRLSGSFVDRREAKGDKYTFTVIYDGEQCIENSESFLRSAKDKRAWTVVHPYFGTLTVQPLSINVDNSKYNISSIAIECVNTLLTEQQFTRSELRGELLELKSNLDVSLATSYTNALNIPLASDSAIMLDNISVWNQIQSLAIKTKRELSEFKSLVTSSVSAANALISDATQAILEFNTLIEFPFRIRSAIKGRFDAFKEQYDRAKRALVEFSGVSVSQATPAREKYAFTLQGASLLASACLCCTLEPDTEENEEDSEETASYSIANDYKTRAQLVEQINKINSFYDEFLADSDALETDRADKKNSYHLPESVSYTLNQIVTKSVRNLEDQIFGALQERTYKADSDTNLIVLAHRLLGLDSEDNTIESLLNTNAIGINELVGIKKDREVVYYV